MGTDINGVFQTKQGSSWQDIPSNYEQSRHYYLFAWLADVRNGYGFAGVPTHEPIRPIATPRGLPDDFTVVDDAHPTTLEAVCQHRVKWMDDKEKQNPSTWMGDHSYSWLTLDEILEADLPKTRKTGIITLEAYKVWDRLSRPEAYCGGISGGDVIVAESPLQITPKTTHVRVEWQEFGEELKYFIDEIRRLRNQYGKDTRFVFGFDS